VLPALRGDAEVATLTSACHSPRLRRNIGYLRVAVGDARIGATFSVPHPVHGHLTATVVQKPHLK
jgi:aminomethyltransferase